MPNMLGTGLLMVPATETWDMALQHPTIGMAILALLVGTIVLGVALARYGSSNRLAEVVRFEHEYRGGRHLAESRRPRRSRSA